MKRICVECGNPVPDDVLMIDETCPSCHEELLASMVPDDEPDPDGPDAVRDDRCSYCGGKGEALDGTPCANCYGEGREFWR